MLASDNVRVFDGRDESSTVELSNTTFLKGSLKLGHYYVIKQLKLQIKLIPFVK